VNERLKTNGYRANPAPIDFEVDCGPLPVRGELPSRLAGVLVRNGPNPLRPDPVQHWFAGHGMVHCFEFANGDVTYRNRWVRTQRWLAEPASVPADVGAFGARPQQRWKSAPRAERFSWQLGGGAQIARVNGALRLSTRASRSIRIGNVCTSRAFPRGREHALQILHSCGVLDTYQRAGSACVSTTLMRCSRSTRSTDDAR
jgi:hypothetical protein